MTSVLENYLAQLNNKETSHWYSLQDVLQEADETINDNEEE